MKIPKSTLVTFCFTKSAIENLGEDRLNVECPKLVHACYKTNGMFSLLLYVTSSCCGFEFQLVKIVAFL